MTARDYAGPAFLSIGFRPFFLGGAAWAATAMVIWIGILAGWWLVAGDYGAVAWHAHEFLFGYIGAVMTGFLLTVVPNWTGRLPVRGRPLLALFLLWLVGRAALVFSDTIGVIPAATVDSLFLLTLAAVALREVIAGRNWRNLKVVGIIGLLAATNILFHAEVIATGVADYAARAATALVLILIMLIGGRIIPSFTRNWLVKQGVARLPVPFGRFDATSIVVAGGGAGIVGRSARRGGDGGRAARRRRGPDRPLVAVGGTADLARAAASHSSCWLCVCADRLLRGRRGGSRAGRHPAERRAPCLDRGRDGADDPRRDDAGHPRPYRTRPRCRWRDLRDLSRRGRRDADPGGGPGLA
jgi:hypothetical protein